MKKNIIEKTGIVGISIEFSTQEIIAIKELQDKFLKRVSDSTDLEVLALLSKLSEGFKAPENVHEDLFGVISAFTPKEQAMCRASVISQTRFERELENAETTVIRSEESNGITFVQLLVKGEDIYRAVLPSLGKLCRWVGRAVKTARSNERHNAESWKSATSMEESPAHNWSL